MRTNAPIYYTLCQAAVFGVIFTMMLAAQRTTIAVPFCADDFLRQTAINILKVTTFCVLLHLPGTLIAAHFGKVSWSFALLPTFFGIIFVWVMFGNDIYLQEAVQRLCDTALASDQDQRSVFIPEWHWPFLKTLADILSYAWGISILFVLGKLIMRPTDLDEDESAF